MKTILTLIFLIPMLVFGQVRDTLNVGQFAISTLGTTDYVNQATVPMIVTSKSGAIVVDEMFQVPKDSLLSYWQTYTRTIGNTGAVLLQRGGNWNDTLFVNTDSVTFASYGRGVKPIIKYIYQDTITFPNVEFRNLTVGNYIYLDMIAPELIAFLIPDSVSTLTVEITALTVSDTTGVAGYYISESSTTPAVNDAGWQLPAPTSYTFNIEGDKVLYAWAKDLTGNISTPLNHTVVITIVPEFEQYAENYTGTIYYISTDGNDITGQGTKAVPYKTIAKANTLTLSGGDAVLYNSRDEFEGTIAVVNSGSLLNPITIGAYGDIVSQPKIYGSDLITGWQQRGSSNIYVTKYSLADITQLFLNDDKMKVARYPNTGYHIITSEVSADSIITASAMTSQATNYYQNARVLTRQKPYYSDMKTVTASTGNTITLSTKAVDIAAGEGFVLMNKLAFLDQAGEWYYDTVTDSLYFWKPDNSPVTDIEVRGSTIADGIQITSKNYVTVQNLDILQQKSKGINLGGACTNVKIKNNLISGQESYGIEAEFPGTGNFYMEYSGNTITDIGGAGMFIYRNDTTIVRDNIISRVGLFEHLGNLGTTQIDAGYGMFVNGRGNLIEYNRIDSVGYHGILWKSYEVLGVYYNGPSTVQYNFVKDATLFKSDGGGIYASGSTAAGSIVRYNIVDGCLGLKEGSSDSRNFGNGIYLDEPARSHTVEYNTALRCTDSGINVHDGTSHIIRYNTFYDCRQSIGVNDTVNSAPSSITYNLSITHARIDTPMFDPRQLCTSYYNDYNMDTWDYNTYVNVYASDLVFKIISPFSYSAFAAWQSYTGGEANSTYVGTDLTAGETQRVFYNATKTAKIFYVNGSTARDHTGASVTGTFTIQPFGSRYIAGTNIEDISETQQFED